MVHHSILIPHRNRNEHLGLCLWSLDRSTRACGCDDWEAVVIDAESNRPPGGGGRVRVVQDRGHPDQFNKARAYNLAIREARGDVLTFLDADAIVARGFVTTIACLDDSDVKRCCYRVRYLPEEEGNRIGRAENRGAYVDMLFRKYEIYRRATEAYGSHDRNVIEPSPGESQPWGNSQFSIRREVLGDVRFDEEIGWGLEDQDMSVQLEAAFGGGYRGVIFTDSEHAMFHLEHGIRAWKSNELLGPKVRVYRLKRSGLLGR